MEIQLSPEAVDAFKKLMTDPKSHGLDFPPLNECFVECEEATPKHILFEQYIDRIKKPLKKVFFYIIMDELYSDRIAKAPDGNLGYKLKMSHI